MDVVPETSVIFIHLTWPIVEKDFINFNCHESLRYYMFEYVELDISMMTEVPIPGQRNGIVLFITTRFFIIGQRF
jgi:hypothetical protein